MAHALLRTLIVAFLDFEGFAVNPSTLLAQQSGRDFELLPVSYEATDAFVSALNPDRFDRLILIGVSARSRSMRLETVARNVVGARADVSGTHPAPGPIDAAGPEVLHGNLWTDSMLAPLHVQKDGPKGSDDAGSYLCNYLYYRALSRFSGHGKRIGFLHVPPTGQLDLVEQASMLARILDHVERDEPSLVRSEYFVRAVSESDLAAFRELRLEALRSHPEAFGADHDESEAQPDAHWIDRIRSGDGTRDGLTCVAVSPGAGLIGMTGIYRQGGAKVRHGASVWGVFVRPAWRGNGVAGAMLAKCIEWAEARGVRHIELAVETGNRAAILCYERAGFVPFGVHRAVIRVGQRFHDLQLMNKQLNPETSHPVG